MRQIIFRGKRIDNGEWIKGHYVKIVHSNCEKHYIFIFGVKHEVDPSTVGQGTGLPDKNGKQIFENDIIKHYRWSRPYSETKRKGEVISLVFWMEGSGGSHDCEHNNKILAKDPSSFNSNPKFTTTVLKDEKGYRHWGWSSFAGSEIIGNKIDNPEMLKEIK
jgi:uncharacterized phage protein (TIGR01671 family)